MYEFALYFTLSTLTGISPAYVVFGHKPTLLLEYKVHDVTDGPVQSFTDHIEKMKFTLQSVCSALTRLAAYIVDYANRHCCKVTFAVDSYAWLFTDHFKLTMTLYWKLVSHYVGPFKSIEQFNPVAFHILLPGSWKVHDVFHALQLKPAINFIPGSSGATSSAFWHPEDDSGEFEVEDILDSCFLYHVHQLAEGFLVLWYDYDLFEVAWEPLAILTNYPDVLSSFNQCRGLHKS